MREAGQKRRAETGIDSASAADQSPQTVGSAATRISMRSPAKKKSRENNGQASSSKGKGPAVPSSCDQIAETSSGFRSEVFGASSNPWQRKRLKLRFTNDGSSKPSQKLSALEQGRKRGQSNEDMHSVLPDAARTPLVEKHPRASKSSKTENLASSRSKSFERKKQKKGLKLVSGRPSGSCDASAGASCSSLHEAGHGKPSKIDSHELRNPLGGSLRDLITKGRKPAFLRRKGSTGHGSQGLVWLDSSHQQDDALFPTGALDRLARGIPSIQRPDAVPSSSLPRRNSLNLRDSTLPDSVRGVTTTSGHRRHSFPSPHPSSLLGSGSHYLPFRHSAANPKVLHFSQPEKHSRIVVLSSTRQTSLPPLPLALANTRALRKARATFNLYREMLDSDRTSGYKTGSAALPFAKRSRESLEPSTGIQTGKSSHVESGSHTGGSNTTQTGDNAHVVELDGPSELNATHGESCDQAPAASVSASGSNQCGKAKAKSEKRKQLVGNDQSVIVVSSPSDDERERPGDLVGLSERSDSSDQDDSSFDLGLHSDDEQDSDSDCWDDYNSGEEWDMMMPSSGNEGLIDFEGFPELQDNEDSNGDGE